LTAVTVTRRVYFLEFYVETGEWGTDEEAFRVFHYTANVRFTASCAPDRIDAGRPLLDFSRQ
jgi:hypothetical protein